MPEHDNSLMIVDFGLIRMSSAPRAVTGTHQGPTQLSDSMSDPIERTYMSLSDMGSHLRQCSKVV